MTSPTLLGLLADCKDRPEDETPRLILADWLEENNQPERSEFVRLGVEMNRLAYYDPRREDLHRRYHDLYHRHYEDWTRGIRTAGFSVEPYQGLIDASKGSTTVGPKALTQLEGSEELAWLERIRLSTQQRPKGSWRATLTAPWMAGVANVQIAGSNLDPDHLSTLGRQTAGRLRHLTFWNSHLPAPSLRAYLPRPESTGLTTLEAVFTHLNPDTLASLAEWPGLSGLRRLKFHAADVDAEGLRGLTKSRYPAPIRVLDLGSNRFGDQGVCDLADSWLVDACVDLDLAFNRIGSMELAALTRSRRLGQLESLNLRDNRIPGSELAAFLSDGPCRNLLVLRLDTNPLGRLVGQAVAESGQLGKLLRLDLSSTRLGCRGTQALARAHGLKSLLRLNLAGNSISSAGIKTLAGQFAGPSLRSLDLCNNKVGPRGMAALAKAPWFGQLKDLELDGNRIGDGGVRALVASDTPPRLGKLSLARNGLTDRGLLDLLSWEGIVSLRELSLTGNPICDVSAAALATCPALANLGILRVGDTRITEAGFRSLMVPRFPGRRIY